MNTKNALLKTALLTAWFSTTAANKPVQTQDLLVDGNVIALNETPRAAKADLNTTEIFAANADSIAVEKNDTTSSKRSNVEQKQQNKQTVDIGDSGDAQTYSGKYRAIGISIAGGKMSSYDADQYARGVQGSLNKSIAENPVNADSLSNFGVYYEIDVLDGATIIDVYSCGDMIYGGITYNQFKDLIPDIKKKHLENLHEDRLKTKPARLGMN